METVILGVNGRGTPARLEPPSAQSPYFGWLDLNDQPNCCRLDEVGAVCTNAQGRWCAIMKNGAALILTPDARDRLLKRMGWTEGKMVERV